MTDNGAFRLYAQLGTLEVRYRASDDVGGGIQVLFERADEGCETSIACGWVPSCKIVSSTGFGEGDVRALERFLRSNAAIIVDLAVSVAKEQEPLRECELCGRALKVVAEDELIRFRGRDIPLPDVERMRCCNPSCSREDTYTARQMQDIEDRLRLVTIGDQRSDSADDAAICEQFGTTLAEVEADVEKYERGGFSDIAFGDPVNGKPEGRIAGELAETYAPIRISPEDPRIVKPKDVDGFMDWGDDPFDEDGEIYESYAAR